MNITTDLVMIGQLSAADWAGWMGGILSGGVAQRVGWALVHFLWQAAAVAALLAMSLRLMRGRSAQVRYAAACAALALLVAMPVATAILVSPAAAVSAVAQASPAVAAEPSPTPTPAPPAHSASAERPPLAAAPPDAQFPPPYAPLATAEPAQAQPPAPAPTPATDAPARVQPSAWPDMLAGVVGPALPWAVMAWLAGVVALAIWHVGGWMQLGRIRRLGTAPPAGLARTFARLVDRLAVARPVRLLESALVKAPLVIGWLRPVVLMPAAVLMGLSPMQIEAILAHELAHVRRLDGLVRLLQAAVETLLFYHPAVWWVSARIRQESENCCDELAVSISGDRHGYAHALAVVAGAVTVDRAAASSATTDRDTADRATPKRRVVAGADSGATSSSSLTPAADGGKLLPRLRRILGAPAGHSRRDTARSALLSAALALAAVAAMIIIPLACVDRVADPSLVPAGDDGADHAITTSPGGAAGSPGRVLTMNDHVTGVAVDARCVWVATWGGVKTLDKSTGQWRFYTRHDGLASNLVQSVHVMDGRVYAFDVLTNRVSVLEPGASRWSVRILGQATQRGLWGSPWQYHQVRPDGIWCLFTGLPDDEFGIPKRLEVQQYELATGRLIKSVDVLALLGTSQPTGRSAPNAPLGFAIVGNDAWIATARVLVKVDRSTWQAKVVPLPAESDWEHIYDGHQAKQRRPNAIYSLAAADGCLWLGMEAGLARFDPSTGKFLFLFVKDEKPYRAIAAVVPEDRSLWFASSTGTISRLNLDTQKAETLGAARGIRRMVVEGDKAWIIEQPEGLSQIDLKSCQVTQVRHEPFDVSAGYDQPLVMMGSVLTGWGSRRVAKDGKEETAWGVQTLDLETDRRSFRRFQEPVLMVPWKDRIWLVSLDAATPLFPLEGRFGSTIGTGSAWHALSHVPEVVGRSNDTIYILMRSYQKSSVNSGREDLYSFEPSSGKLAKLLTVPPEWRQAGARVMGATSGHVYLTHPEYRIEGKTVHTFIDSSGQPVKRFSLEKRSWQDVTIRAQRNDYVCEAAGSIWWASGDKLNAFDARLSEPASRFTIPGHFINSLRALDDDSIEVITSSAVLKYDGSRWTAVPLVPESRLHVFEGLDGSGRPNGMHVVRSGADGAEIAVYDSKPDAARQSETPLDVVVQRDGVIRVAPSGLPSASPATQPASEPELSDIAPAALSDEQAMEKLVAAISATMPKDWEEAGRQSGDVAPTHWEAGKGTQFRWQRKGFEPLDWKNGKGGNVCLWIMDAAYPPKQDKYAGPNAMAAAAMSAAVEIASWRGRRVFLWGGGNDWPKLKADILAALKATDAAATQPAISPATATATSPATGPADQEEPYRRLYGRYKDAVLKAVKAGDADEVARLTERFNESIGGKLLYVRVQRLAPGEAKPGEQPRWDMLLDRHFSAKKLALPKVNYPGRIVGVYFDEGFVLLLPAKLGGGRLEDDVYITMAVHPTVATQPVTEPSTQASQPAWNRSDSGLESRIEVKPFADGKGGRAIAFALLVRNRTDKDIKVGGFLYNGVTTIDGQALAMYPQPILDPAAMEKMLPVIKAGWSGEFGRWYCPLDELFTGALTLQGRDDAGKTIKPELKPGRHTVSYELGPIQTGTVEFTVPPAATGPATTSAPASGPASRPAN